MAMQGIMTESAHKQIDCMGEIQFTMFVTVLAQQLTMNAAVTRLLVIYCWESNPANLNVLRIVWRTP